MMRLDSYLACSLACGLLFFCDPGAAFAHATLEKTETPNGASYRGVVKIGHGCKGSATTAVRVQIPEGVIAVKPMPKAGWALATTKGPYLKAYKAHGGQVSAGVKEIVWSGGSLADDHYDEFIFSSTITDHFTPGEILYFPVTQTCVEGANNWVQIPGPGQSARDLAEPAPMLRIAASDRKAAPAPEIIQKGALRIEGPWLRATPGGAKVAAGYIRIANTGKEPDRLLGATMPLAARGELHEMSRDNGVMVMRALPGGLEIPAGGAIDLSPGGNHLMFQDLNGVLREGESVQGALIFERAGTVPVTFRIGGIGAATASGHQH